MEKVRCADLEYSDIYKADDAFYFHIYPVYNRSRHVPISNVRLRPNLPLPPKSLSCLEGSVLEQLLEVGLEPGTSLRSRSQRISVAAVSIVASGARVAGAIALSARLDPDNSVDKRIAGVGRRQAAKASALDVAPVSPLLLSGWLHAAAALVHDEVRVPAVLREQRRDGVDVQLLVVVLVALRVRGGGGGVVAVVVGDVGHEAAQRLGLAGVAPDFGEEFGGGREVGVPTKPAGVAGVDVRVHVREVEGLDGVFDAGDVGGLRVGALLDVQVGDEVAETVGLCACG